jgi:hypothetical protein
LYIVIDAVTCRRWFQLNVNEILVSKYFAKECIKKYEFCHSVTAVFPQDIKSSKGVRITGPNNKFTGHSHTPQRKCSDSYWSFSPVMNNLLLDIATCLTNLGNDCRPSVQDRLNVCLTEVSFIWHDRQSNFILPKLIIQFNIQHNEINSP